MTGGSASLILLAQAAAPDDPGTAALVLAAVLLVVAVGLLFLEVFFPSFGIISIVGLGCAAGAVALALQAGLVPGIVFIALAVVGLPGAVYGALKIMPRSGMFTRAPEAEPSAAASEPGLPPVGAKGLARTTLRPSGVAVFGDRRVSVVTDGEMLEAGAELEVVRVEAAHVVVRAARP